MTALHSPQTKIQFPKLPTQTSTQDQIWISLDRPGSRSSYPFGPDVDDVNANVTLLSRISPARRFLWHVVNGR